MSNQELRLYIGTYTRREPPAEGQPGWTYQGRGEGIYRYRLDLVSGTLHYEGLTGQVVNPSYMAIHPQRPYLYAVNQAVALGDRPGGAVSAFAIEADTGELTFLNQQPAQGSGPCHLSVDQSGRFVLVANYRSGTVTMLPIQEGGQLAEASDTHQHQGSSINPTRQEGPHAHSINLDLPNRYAFVPDLGLDRIMSYRLDLAGGKLQPNPAQPWLQVEAGAGPRHFAFHPTGQYAYVINELDSTIVAFTYESEQGALSPIQTISTLPEGFEGQSHCADIHVHPTGRFLYGSNRGHDSIASYAVDPETGCLSLLGHTPSGGQSPRNFALDPSGTYLLAANQNSDNVVVFHIHKESGQLTSAEQEIAVPTPVCIKFIQLASYNNSPK